MQHTYLTFGEIDGSETAHIQMMQHLGMHKQLISGIWWSSQSDIELFELLINKRWQRSHLIQVIQALKLVHSLYIFEYWLLQYQIIQVLTFNAL